MTIIKKVNNWVPEIDDSAFIAETAVITGEVKIAARAGIWYGAILRGDMGAIEIGEGSNIQDGAIVHCTTDYSKTLVGKNVTVGHGAILHGCILKDSCLIGMGAVVMDNAVVNTHTIVAAGAVVLENQVLEGGYLYAGTPAKQIKKLTDAQIEGLKENAAHYVDVIDWYKTDSY